ncbi:hypothetical protein D9M71_109860 [compost metagenome]
MPAAHDFAGMARLYKNRTPKRNLPAYSGQEVGIGTAGYQRRRCLSEGIGMGCNRGGSIRPSVTPIFHARACSQSFMVDPL